MAGMKTLAVLGCCLALAKGAHALVIASFNPGVNDRFGSGFPSAPAPNTSPSFLGAGHDLSGIGWNPGYPQQNIAMISDRYFVQANHASAGATLSFFSPVLHAANPGNPAAAIVTYAVDTAYSFRPLSEALGLQGDLSIGRLSSTALNLVTGTAAMGITHYPVLDLTTHAAYLNLPLLVYGHGGSPAVSPRLGTNDLDSFFPLDLYGDDGIDESFTFGYSDSGAPATEAALASADSGGPTFTAWNGRLAILGIHSATGTVGSVFYSADSFIPDYLDSMGSNGVPFDAVPEPSRWVACALGLALMLLRRSRHPAAQGG